MATTYHVLQALLDPGAPFLELSALAGHEMYEAEQVPSPADRRTMYSPVCRQPLPWLLSCLEPARLRLEPWGGL